MIELPNGTTIWEADAESEEVLPGLTEMCAASAQHWIEMALEGVRAHEAHSANGKRYMVSCVPKGSLAKRREALQVAMQNLETALREIEGADEQPRVEEGE